MKYKQDGLIIAFATFLLICAGMLIGCVFIALNTPQEIKILLNYWNDKQCVCATFGACALILSAVLVLNDPIVDTEITDEEIQLKIDEKATEMFDDFVDEVIDKVRVKKSGNLFK